MPIKQKLAGQHVSYRNGETTKVECVMISFKQKLATLLDGQQRNHKLLFLRATIRLKTRTSKLFGNSKKNLLEIEQYHMRLLIIGYHIMICTSSLFG